VPVSRKEDLVRFENVTSVELEDELVAFHFVRI
jgi:hypothetical protein